MNGKYANIRITDRQRTNAVFVRKDKSRKPLDYAISGTIQWRRRRDLNPRHVVLETACINARFPHIYADFTDCFSSCITTCITTRFDFIKKYYF